VGARVIRTACDRGKRERDTRDTRGKHTDVDLRQVIGENVVAFDKVQHRLHASSSHGRSSSKVPSVVYVSLDRPLRWRRVKDSPCSSDSRHSWVPRMVFGEARVATRLKLNLENQTTKMVDVLADDGAFPLVSERADVDGDFITRYDKIGHGVYVKRISW